MTATPFREPRGERPRLAVVIPTHNGGRWLATTLASLAAQTHVDFACLLIDSSPTDTTAEIARGFQHRLNLRVERRPDLPSWMEKTNFGVRESASDYVCMLHQDDVWEPLRAASVQCWLDAAPEMAMHLHASWIIDHGDRRLGVWRCPLPQGVPIPVAVLRERLIVQNFIAICAPVIRRDAFLAVGGLDETLWYTADWDLYLKLSNIGPWAYHRERLCGFRIHGTAQTVAGSRRAEAFRSQLTSVLERHQVGLDPAVLARARASIEMNTALAAALHRRHGPLLRAIGDVAALGPRGIHAFFRDTRLLERLLPRLRSHLAGQMTA